MSIFVMIMVNYIIKITLLIIHSNARTKYLFFFFFGVCVWKSILVNNKKH